MLTVTLSTCTCLHSFKLFCKGVPVNTIRLLVATLLTTSDKLELSLLRTCPSSHIMISGPGSRRYLEKDSRSLALRILEPEARFRNIS